MNIMSKKNIKKDRKKDFKNSEKVINNDRKYGKCSVKDKDCY